MSYDAYDIKKTKDLCQNNLFAFFTEFWPIIEPAKELTTNWHIKELCEKLQTHAERVSKRLPRDKHLIINIPPGTTKSTIVSIMFPAWLWINWPWMKIITASFDEGLALRMAVKSRDIIKSELYRYAFGDKFSLKYDVNKKSEYANDQGGFRVATSVTGSIFGYHADIWIWDDLIDPRGAKSKAEIQSTIDFIDLTVPSRMTDLNVSTIFMIMQRLGDGDPTGHILNRSPENWEHICLPAELTNDVKPIEYREFYENGLFDPIRLSKPILNDMRLTLGSKDYAAQYLQRPAPEEGNLFKQVWFNRFTMFGLRAEALRMNKEIIWHFRGDTAYTEKTENDPSGFLAFCYLGPSLYIRDYVTVRKEMQDLIPFCKDFAARNEYNEQSTFKIEPKASGLSLIQMLKTMTNLNISKAAEPNKDKIARANLIIPMVEAGRVFLLDSASWVDTFLHEVCTFPDALHDEAVDLLSMTLKEKVVSQSGGTILGMRSIDA